MDQTTFFQAEALQWPVTQIINSTKQPNLSTIILATQLITLGSPRDLKICLSVLPISKKAITLIEQKMQAAASTPEQTTTREYYSVPEFADLVGKNTTRTANGVVLNASMPRNVSLAVAMPKVGKFQSLN